MATSQRYDHNLGAKEHSFRVFTHYCPTEDENDCIDKEATYTWTILGDNIPPDTLLDVTQDGNNITVHADCTDNRCDYQCSWISESGPWEDCNAVTEYKDMTCGTHQIWVRALDETGNEDNDPATDLWQVTEPASLNGLVLLHHPPTETYETDAHFLTGAQGLSDEGYHLECILDDVAADCDKYVHYESLEKGPHSFKVIAYDCSGEVMLQGMQADYSWTIVEPPLAEENYEALENNYNTLWIPAEKFTGVAWKLPPILILKTAVTDFLAIAATM